MNAMQGSSQMCLLSEIKSREEKSQLIDFGDDELNSSEGGFLGEEQHQVWSKSDVFLLDENSKLVQQREKEIQSVVKSISDLNVIFKELAVMISEQVHFFYTTFRIFFRPIFT